jgi:hypothetical protein
MSRFYFDLEIDNWFLPDPRGMELPDVAAARSAAENYGFEAISLRLKRGEGLGSEVLHVRDEAGACVLRLPYAAFLRAKAKH